MLDITTLAAWGEFIGGAGVIASLIYLASQIRQNSKLLRASTASVTHDTSTRIPILTAEDPEVTRVYWEGLADRNALSALDRHRFDMLISTYMSGVQQEHQFAQDGVISPSIWTARVRATRWLLQEPGMQPWWAEWGGRIYSDDFIAFVDGLIREGAAAE